MDVLYSLQGQRYEIYGVEIKQKINYVKIPVYFSYNGDASRTLSFIGKVGPQVSILADSKLVDKDGEDINPDTKDRYNDVTFGAMAAAGAQFKLNNKVFLTTMLVLIMISQMQRTIVTTTILPEEQKRTTVHWDWK